MIRDEVSVMSARLHAALESPLHVRGLVAALLRLEALREPEQRPAVLAEALRGPRDTPLPPRRRGRPRAASRRASAAADDARSAARLYGMPSSSVTASRSSRTAVVRVAPSQRRARPRRCARRSAGSSAAADPSASSQTPRAVVIASSAASSASRAIELAARDEREPARVVPDADRVRLVRRRLRLGQHVLPRGRSARRRASA